MPLPEYVLPSSVMRCCHALANGQWLQVKTTSVPFLPATSAIESDLPSWAAAAAGLNVHVLTADRAQHGERHG